MTQRSVVILATAAMLAIVLSTALLQWPVWAGIVPALLVAALIMFLYFRSVRRKQFAGITDPALLERVEAALRRIGMADVPHGLVDGNGLPVVYVRQGQLAVSPVAGNLLTDAELEALMLQALSLRPGANWQAGLRYWAPWAAVLLITGVISLYTGFPWIGPAFLVMVIWTNVDVRRRAVSGQAVEQHTRAFLDRGGDARSLLSALIKTQSTVIRAGFRQPAVVTQIRGLLRITARMGGISPAELEEYLSNLQAPLELRAPEEVKATRRVWVFAMAALLLVLFALAIPYLLTNLMEPF